LKYMAELIQLVQGTVIENESMSRHSSFGIGGTASAYITPKNIDDLSKILRFANQHGIQIYFIGSGSNILVSDNGLDGIVISPAKALTKLSFDKGIIEAESGVMLGHLVKETSKQNLTGFESLGGVPGTLGGALLMNAGAFGSEISNHLISLKVMEMNGEIRTMMRDEIEFSYRQSSLRKDVFILSAIFELEKCEPEIILEKRLKASKKRKSTQPLKYRSAGSVFKNPQPNLAAGYLIDQVGLKGYRVGDAEISKKHANFFINRGKANASDITALIRIARKKVEIEFNIMLELEIKTYGFNASEFMPHG